MTASQLDEASVRTASGSGPDAADVPAAAGSAPDTPRRPRMRISMLLTTALLIGIVVVIYAVVPARDNQIVTRAIEVHRSPPPWELVQPSPGELDAWTRSHLGKPVPWPGQDTEARAGQAAGAAAAALAMEETEVLGAAAISVLNRPAVLVRMRVAGDEVSMVVKRARDVTPRRYRRTDGDLHAISWRKGSLTFVAVGPVRTVARWQARIVGVP